MKNQAMHFGRQPRGARGAALLLAMMIVALIATAAAGMVWLQTRAVQVEAAERARAQAGWILLGAVDWARLILREDQNSHRRAGDNATFGTDPWAKGLEEARLSSFLAADKDNNADASVDAFISGHISDVQSRFNVRGVIDPSGKPLPLQVAALQRLANLAGAPSDTAARIADALGRALAPAGDEGPRGPPLRPVKFADLAWLGIETATLARLAPWVDLLPLATTVNVNTASREVLTAAIDGLDLGTAQRLVQRAPYKTLDEVQAQLPQNVKVEGSRVGVGSNWFEVAGRLRLEERVLEELVLVQRDGDRVNVRRRERRSFTLDGR